MRGDHDRTRLVREGTSELGRSAAPAARGDDVRRGRGHLRRLPGDDRARGRRGARDGRVMRRERVRDVLAGVADGSLSLDAALDALAFEPVEELPFATIDHHRALRQGFPEVIFGGGKTPDQVEAIAARLAARGDGFLATRVEPTAADRLRTRFPAVEVNELA